MIFCQRSAKHKPSVNPMYPVPIIPIFILENYIKNNIDINF